MLYNVQTHRYSYYYCCCDHKYQPAAEWRWIRSLHIFCSGVYSFVICWPLLFALRPRSSLHGPTLGLLGLFGKPLDHFGTPWDAMEVALVRPGTFNSFNKNERLIPSKWLSSSQPAHKSDLAEFRHGSALSRQSGARAAAPNPTSLAPWARTTSVWNSLPQTIHSLLTVAIAYCHIGPAGRDARRGARGMGRRNGARWRGCLLQRGLGGRVAPEGCLRGAWGAMGATWAVGALAGGTDQIVSCFL